MNVLELTNLLRGWNLDREVAVRVMPDRSPETYEGRVVRLVAGEDNRLVFVADDVETNAARLPGAGREQP